MKMSGIKTYRMTRQRQVILDELIKSKIHPTAEQIYGLTIKQIPNISLGTVYRNLDILVKQGQVRKIETSGGKARYDGDLNNHYHLRCVECGSIEDIYDLSFMEMHPDTVESKNFKILGHKLEFYGICRKCKK